MLAAYANLQLFGQVGLRVLLGHLVEMAETLREHLEDHDSTTVLIDEQDVEQLVRDILDARLAVAAAAAE